MHEKKKSNNTSHSAAHSPPGNRKGKIIMCTEQKGRSFNLITRASVLGAILMIMSHYINQERKNLKVDGQGAAINNMKL